MKQLPTIPLTTYELILPSTSKSLRYRQFIVKEEKALMIAQQSEDPKVMVNTLRNVIEACVLDKIDAASLSTFDIEYIFLKLRACSVGEIAELIFNCLECGDEKAKMIVRVDLSKIEVTFTDGHSQKIELTSDTGIMMKYPNMETVIKLDNPNTQFAAIIDCIDFIYDAESVYSSSEYTEEVLSQFINGLTRQNFEKIQNFFVTMPRLEHTIEFSCPVCKHVHTQTLSGIESFF